eukprot:TRINITY_DN32635_c0_g1_i1.p1 TRINITY_DN32635_c0_g1~~TRINITY_DN32635_c0_g1_i1.p1  ORF type:complete len:445 (+),score=11.15 TRINITY_DN32635_c0_g1_i1:92-1426(+)
MPPQPGGAPGAPHPRQSKVVSVLRCAGAPSQTVARRFRVFENEGFLGDTVRCTFGVQPDACWHLEDSNGCVVVCSFTGLQDGATYHLVCDRRGGVSASPGPQPRRGGADCEPTDDETWSLSNSAQPQGGKVRRGERPAGATRPRGGPPSPPERLARAMREFDARQAWTDRRRAGRPSPRAGCARPRASSPGRQRSGSPRLRAGSPRLRAGSPRPRPSSPGRQRTGSPRQRGAARAGWSRPRGGGSSSRNTTWDSYNTYYTGGDAWRSELSPSPACGSPPRQARQRSASASPRRTPGGSVRAVIGGRTLSPAGARPRRASPSPGRRAGGAQCGPARTAGPPRRTGAVALGAGRTRRGRQPRAGSRPRRPCSPSPARCSAAPGSSTYAVSAPPRRSVSASPARRTLTAGALRNLAAADSGAAFVRSSSVSRHQRDPSPSPAARPWR